ncbi:D-aminoacyl-tRNA deacylase-like [Tubulanus polymorphus]|uniref:D-aminoacyl-tRNA deacylase-like n=1 Tax=Tubulanus polymorphus TaxID=672921 RepID=UPI003DA43812
MRAVIQRVSNASVVVGDEVVSSIGRGICVLLGISKDDTTNDIKYMVKKILNLRVFEDGGGKRWNKGVMDKDLEVLCVSQFTLTCTMKGHKPDFRSSMGADQSESFYNDFLKHMKDTYKPEKIKDGRFGAYMQVHIQNDGPVTIQLDSPSSENTTTKVKKSDNKTEEKQSATHSDCSSVDAEHATQGIDTSLSKTTNEKLNLS